MSIVLNAFPLIVPDLQIEVCRIPYDKGILYDLRAKHGSTHAFRRQGNSILIFSGDGAYPVSGTPQAITLKDNLDIFCLLVKDGLKRHFSKFGRNLSGFNPIEVVSILLEDNLIAPILGHTYPFKICASYSIDTRIIQGSPCLVIDCSTRMAVTQNALYFMSNGFDITGRYVVRQQEDGHRKLLGLVIEREGEMLSIRSLGGQVVQIDARDVYLEVSRENLEAYISHTHSKQKESYIERIRQSISTFNGGINKKDRIEKIKNYIQSKNVTLINGVRIEIKDWLDIENDCAQMQKPMFVFNDNGEADWVEKGLTKYGPYTKRTFDRNNPSICVICAQDDKGRVEQFVRKLLKGIPDSKYFSSGLEGKFALGTSRVEVFTTTADSADAYRNAIEAAIRRTVEKGERWDLALVQISQSFKKLGLTENSYYISKNLFFLHQVPVQSFTIELLMQNECSLGYSLNNMALACYAKMGGIPWLLKSSPTISHELVIGIGSANVGQERGGGSQRIMGITTVFSGDGSYIVSNTSKAVLPESYCDALEAVLKETIENIQNKMNWQKGDAIRLIFHAQVKKFNKDEIAAVRAVIDQYREYQIEYAFVKISDDHGLHMFDSSTENEQKGRLAPPRGKIFKLSKHEMLVYLIGQREVRRDTDGHPRGVILNVHRDSTFKDIRYLSEQLYAFASHSWRSYFPNPMPVTISYSDLIARNLGWLNQLPGWNNSIMIGRIGISKWFL